MTPGGFMDQNHNIEISNSYITEVMVLKTIHEKLYLKVNNV